MTGFFKSAPETELLVEHLRLATESGEEFISYDDLNAVVNMDVQVRPGYGYLRSARERAKKDFGAVWECEQGKGLYLMATTDRCGIAKRTAKQVRSRVRRGESVLDTVDDFVSLSDSDKNKYNTSRTIFEVIKASSAPKTIRRIEGAIEDSNVAGELPLTDALDMIKQAQRRQTRD